MALETETDSSNPHPPPLLERIAKAIGIAAEGAAISIAIAGLGLILLLIGLKVIGVIVLLIAVAVGSFFRDPERFPAVTNGVVISGADGKVTDIAEVAFAQAGGRPYRRVSVFMSPLDVHVNRAMVGGEVTMVQHTSGEFRAAFRDDASEHNERNLIVLNDPNGHIFGMLQVAGYLARRIVCRLRPHDRVQIGQRIGLIMFGSRVDHFFPTDYRVKVAVGQRVRAGESVIGAIES